MIVCLCGHEGREHFHGGRCNFCGCLIFEPLPAGWSPAKVAPFPEVVQEIHLPQPRGDVGLPEYLNR